MCWKFWREGGVRAVEVAAGIKVVVAPVEGGVGVTVVVVIGGMMEELPGGAEGADC